VSRAAAPRGRTSLAPSVAFTVLALILSVGAYVIAGFGKRGQQLLGPIDAIPVARHRPEAIVHRPVLGLRRLQLLQDGRRHAIGEDVARQKEHRQPVDRRAGGAGHHVGRTGADRRGAHQRAQPVRHFREGRCGVHHRLFVSALVVAKRTAQLIEGLANPEERLRRIARLHLERLGRDRDLAVVFQVELRQSTKFMEQFSSTYLRDYLGLIRETIASGQQTGAFRADINPTVAAKVFFGALDEMATNWVLSKRRYSLIAEADAVVDLFVGGVGRSSNRQISGSPDED